MDYNIPVIPILFLIGEKLLYNVVLVSAVQQCESAISIYISPPSHPTPHLTGGSC